ncbi:hypothetical protein TEA_025427 [Camellia sinensis var. sinensis]|uniref:Prefoldin subunit 3 n=1 Tax=Camellia sinensis var. sinensis TaxID=542762 RepID=A0A4S4DMH6_CAMSN|nr:hypothetical protein TEA_025427 [Camellia sinensis var. sinensis]
MMKRRSRRPMNGIKKRLRTLKKLVQNRRSKGLDGLFKETADYIVCLQMKVKVMQMMVKLQQYRLVEMKLLAQQRDLQAKIPDIEKCLDVVATLQAKKGTGGALLADFEVSEGIYSRARIEDTDSVCLWLGANVMLEHSCEEATDLLQRNLENARASLEVLVTDLQFLRDQVTITQVTIARIYNWDVHQRRLRQVSAAKDS